MCGVSWTCGGDSGIRTRSTVLMWMNGQYDVVEVENKDVVHLGNSKVAASWIFSIFADEIADQSFKILDMVDPLLIFDWYYFTMKLEMAVGATRRRRWASFELGPEGGWCLKFLRKLEAVMLNIKIDKPTRVRVTWSN